MRKLLALLLILNLSACDSGNIDNEIVVSNNQSQDQDQDQSNADVEGTSECRTECADSVLSTYCGGVLTSQQEIAACPSAAPTNTLDQPDLE
jgi:hypothetical protein